MLKTDRIVNATDLPDEVELDATVLVRLNRERGVLEITDLTVEVVTIEGDHIGTIQRTPKGNDNCVVSLVLALFLWTYVNPAFSADEAAATSERKEAGRA